MGTVVPIYCQISGKVDLILVPNGFSAGANGKLHLQRLKSLARRSL